jgi:DDE family transposase
MPASVETTAPLPGLSPVADKPIIAAFDAEGFSASGGLLTLREIEQRLGLAPRLAAQIADPREPTQVVHPTEEIVRFRMLMIAAGYADGNDADVLRHDPMFKLAMGRLPTGSPLCSQSTISRLENLPDRRTLLRMGYGLIDLYCQSFCQVPKRIVLDIDDHFDAAHGAQELRVFNAHYDEHGFSPMVVFDGEGRLGATVLRPAQRPSGREIVMLLRRLIGRLRANWPRVEILLRADSHDCAPEVLRFCRDNQVDWVLGVATTPTLRRHVIGLEQSTAKRFAAAGGRDKARRFKEFHDGAGSWDRVERIIARVEAGPEGGIHASSLPVSPAAQRAPSMKRPTANGARWKTISRPSSATSRLIAPPATRQAPLRCGCSCMPAPTGSCGPCARRCRAARRGGACSSIRCVCWWSTSSSGWWNSNSGFVCTCRPARRIKPSSRGCSGACRA